MDNSEEYESIITKDKSREENIKLWRSAEKTPASQVKAAKLNGQNIKSVKPHYQRMKATEIFGPFGKGWGVIPESVVFSRHVIGDTHLLNYTATLFYVVDGAHYEFPINATEKEAYITSGGKGYLKIDDSADKKVATNALTKGLSFLGFSADVFHGLYDDASYIQARQNEENANQDVDQKQEDLEYRKWRQKVVADVMLCTSVTELENIYFESLRKMQEKNDNPAIVSLNDAKVKRYEELTKKEK